MTPFQEFAWLVRSLSEDIRVCENRLDLKPKKTGNPYRRHYVRAHFALFEGMTHLMGRMLLDAYDRGALELEFEQRTILDERSFSLDASGKVKPRDSYNPANAKLKFIFRLFASASDSEKLLHREFEGKGWNAYRDAQKLRNRLTHPKRKSDLIVRDEELREIDLASEWFLDVTSKVLNASADKLGIGERRK